MQEPGEYTMGQLSEGMGEDEHNMRRKIARMIKEGKATSRRGRAPGKDGRILDTMLYRLK